VPVFPLALKSERSIYTCVHQRERPVGYSRRWCVFVF
jgi:hypothetical protein